MTRLCARISVALVTSLMCVTLSTCAPRPTHDLSPISRPGLAAPTPSEILQAVVAPPLGWKPEPLKSSASHKHQVWLSPSGKTAYGVIYFTMPLPFGEDVALEGFLAHMRRTEGDAKLLSERDDPNLPGIRFVAEGGLYRVRTSLIVRGFHGWAIYAGTKHGEVEDPAELEIAERARDDTSVGLPHHAD